MKNSQHSRQKYFRLTSSLLLCSSLFVGGCTGKKQLAVEQEDLNVDSVQTVSADMNKLIRLTDFGSDQAAPSFSPDDLRVIYQSNGDGNWELYELELSTLLPQRLTDTPEAEEFPSYSPDGLWILCTVHDPSTDPSPPRDILLISSDMRTRKIIAKNGADDWYPRFSPDGSAIYFVSDRVDDRRGTDEQNRISAIFRYDMDSENLEQISSGNDESAPWPLENGSFLYRDANGGLLFSDTSGYVSELENNLAGDWILGGPSALSHEDYYLMGKLGTMGSQIIHRKLSGDFHIFDLEEREADRGPCISNDGSSLLFYSKIDGQWDIFMRSSL
jgi:hypothetical protein